MPKKKTHEEFINRLSNVNPYVTPLEKYNGALNKIKCKCNICGHEWAITPQNLQKGQGCPKCYIKKKTMNHEEFLSKFKTNNSQCNTIIFLTNYTKSNSPIECKCLIDGYIWTTSPHNLLSDHGCPMCQRRVLSEKHKVSNELFQKKAKENNKKLDVLEEYTDSNTKIKVKCKIHDLIFYALPDNILRGHGCKLCRSDIVSLTKRKTHNEFKSQIYELYGDDVEILDTYVNDTTPLHFRHKCGTIFVTIPSIIIQRLSCPKCKIKSYGEEKIESFLIENKIKYYSQYRFHNLYGIKNRLLSYDFFLPDYNILIEYQGEQHAHPIDIFGGEEQFKVQQEHDKRKRIYASTNNYELLEIWYTDYKNINKILGSRLLEQSA